ncbi:MAG: LPS export ABC transporter periplasmic protein LptC [Rhodospirillales bacterium]|jgi:lipopolysaccharide export system protein LptC|nr:LPS export ABC transporter periplasmic protein LptC [Rhodospirillales bacterium]
MNAPHTDTQTWPSEPQAGVKARTKSRTQAPFAPRVAKKFGTGYSRFVGMMKVLLPVGAAVLIVLVAAWPYLQPSDGRFLIGFSTMIATETENSNIVNPRLVGTDADNNPFSITADLAKNFRIRKDFWESGEPVALEMPKADMTLDDGSWLVLTANTGLLSPTEKTLELTGAVNLFHDSGYELRTEMATIDLQAGAARSNVPVEGQGPFGNLNSEGMKLSDKGRTITFTGKAKLVIYPSVGKETP